MHLSELPECWVLERCASTWKFGCLCFDWYLIFLTADHDIIIIVQAQLKIAEKMLTIKMDFSNADIKSCANLSFVNFQLISEGA